MCCCSGHASLDSWMTFSSRCCCCCWPGCLVGDEPCTPPRKKNWASRKMYVDIKGIVSARKKSNNTSTASRLDTHESSEREMMEAEHDSGPATNFPLS